jgi:hypothetical protein
LIDLKDKLIPEINERIQKDIISKIDENFIKKI